MQQLQQKDWIEQQIKERDLYREQAKYTQDIHDEQQLHFHELLTQAQNQHTQHRIDMEKSVKDANMQAAKEKRDRDIAQRNYEQL